MARRDFYNPKVPKVVRINADRNDAAVYKNLGDSQRIKFLWAETTTLGKGGTSEVVASGTFGPKALPNAGDRRDSYMPGGGSYGKTISDIHVFVTPLDEPAGFIWADIDVVADTITITSSAAGSDSGVDVDVLFFTT